MRKDTETTAPRTVDLSFLAQKWPSAVVARRKVEEFSGGLVASGSVANADSRGEGPEGRIVVNGQVAYTVPSFIKWLEKRSTRTTSTEAARRQRKQNHSRNI